MAQAALAHTTIRRPRPRTSRFIFTRQRRERLEFVVQEIIELLDALDGDPDLEDAPWADADREPDDIEEDGGDDENSLGWGDSESGGLVERRLTCAEDDREISDGDDEPSLGWPEAKARREFCPFTGALEFDGMDQTRCGHGCAFDLEDGHDGKEPDEFA